MNLLDADINVSAMHSRLSWDSVPAALVAGAGSWSRASRRLLDDCRDEQGHRFPLRDEVWLTVYPPQTDRLWRVEEDTIGPTLVGRATTADGAVGDWRKRFRAIVQRYLELRPFEMTAEDRVLWTRIQSVVDVAQYKATKPIVVRQLGKIVQVRTGIVVVQWEDGARERVNPLVFDEVFSRFRLGQPFEAVVTRHPLTFRILRAEAVRRLLTLPMREEVSKAIWDRAVGAEERTENEVGLEDLDEQFWLTPPK